MTNRFNAGLFVTWTTILIFCCIGSVAGAQVPVDTWSVTIKGNVIGSGYITFWDDFTLTGYIMMRPNLTLKDRRHRSQCHGEIQF